MNSKRKLLGLSFLGLIIFLCSIYLIIRGEIIQDPLYHQFSDGQTLFAIPNFWNVISNLPFILLGILGLRNGQKSRLDATHRIVLYLGILLIGLGSAYYHLVPTNFSLIWDRLPMTLVFMSLYAVLVAEFITKKYSNKLLILLLLIGLYSIFHWVFVEDLRIYIVVQFFPIISIPIILLTFSSSGIGSKAFWVLLLWYAGAKLSEHFDTEIHSYLHYISGHSIKHLLAAAGLFHFYLLDNKKLKVTESSIA